MSVHACLNNVEHLFHLNDEGSRKAGNLARRSAGQVDRNGSDAEAEADVPRISAEKVRSVIRARRHRSQYFSEQLFADPAWDILLDLLAAEVAQHRVSVSSLCVAAAVPATTALRWMKVLVEKGMIVRREDPHDARRTWVELAPPTSLQLRRYFAHSVASNAI